MNNITEKDKIEDVINKYEELLADEDRIERIVSCLEEPDNTYLNYYTDYLKVLNKEVVEKPANIDEEGTTRNLYNNLAIV